MQASSKQNKLLRLWDMLATIHRNRANAVVLLATYSTSAFYFAYTCARLCRLLHVPYVPCLHGGNLPDRIKQSPRLANTYFGKSFMNVAVSGYLQKAVADGGLQCIVIPNSINIYQYPFSQRTQAQAKLLWVRSFHQLYNPQMAIKVLAALSKTHSNATLTMVGPDKDESLASCKKLAKELGVEQQVTFTGRLTKEAWIALSASHDIFINTSYADNLPVSIIEAMALGLVVISTNVGGVPYLVNNCINGFLVNANADAEMVNCVIDILKNNPLVSEISKNARTTSLQFDEKQVLKEWAAMLLKI